MLLHPLPVGDDRRSLLRQLQAMLAAVALVLRALEQPGADQRLDRDGRDAALDAAQGADIARRVILRIVGEKEKSRISKQV